MLIMGAFNGNWDMVTCHSGPDLAKEVNKL